MSLETLLRRKRDAIVEEWSSRVMQTYPAEAATLFAKQGDRFRNPVGRTVAQGAEALLDALLDGADREEVSRVVDGIVRMRAVQDFLPSEAVGVFFDLKDVVLRSIDGEGADLAEVEGLLGRIDEIALGAFDRYVECRERIYELRAKEAWNRSFKLLERAGYVEEIPMGDERHDSTDLPGSCAKRGVDT
jgi:hypothetical protein